MIEWISKDAPEAKRRIAILLPDGRVCSGRVIESGGFELEYVDSIDLISYQLAEDQKWVYLDEERI